MFARSRRRRAFVPMMLCCLAFSPLAAPAGAAGGIGRPIGLVEIASITFSSGLSSASASSSVITCTLSAQWPHDSTHVLGTVNAVSTISCTAPVSSLWIWTDLFVYPGYLYASGSNSNSGRAFIQTNAANACVAGYYDNVADGYIVAPPGYTPPTAWLSHSSGYRFVDCA